MGKRPAKAVQTLQAGKETLHATMSWLNMPSSMEIASSLKTIPKIQNWGDG